MNTIADIMIARVMALEARDTAHRNSQAAGYRIAGEELRAMRREKNVTLHQLAEHLGVSITFLSDMERGNRRLSLKHIHKAHALLLK